MGLKIKNVNLLLAIQHAKFLYFQQSHYLIPIQQMNIDFHKTKSLGISYKNLLLVDGEKLVNTTTEYSQENIEKFILKLD